MGFSGAPAPLRSTSSSTLLLSIRSSPDRCEMRFLEATADSASGRQRKVTCRYISISRLSTKGPGGISSVAMIERESRTLNGPLGGCIVGSGLWCFFCLSFDPGVSPWAGGSSSTWGGSSSQVGAVMAGIFDGDGLQKRPLRVRWLVAGRQPLYWPL